MTGFGAADGRVGTTRVSVELRTVNHRFFNPSLKLPSALSRWESDVRDALRQRITRGHVSVTARLTREQDGGLAIDAARFADTARQLTELAVSNGLALPLVGDVLRLPDIIKSGNEEEAELELAPFLAIVTAAADALGTMRESEGARLVAVLLERFAIVEAAVDRIAERAPVRLTAARDRMRERVRELADGIALDEQRIAQEIALLADRLDVGEEIDRFRTHLSHAREILAPTSDEVGKKLGFLLQELLREANTMGSKANDAPMQREVIAIKEELERIREQVENLE